MANLYDEKLKCYRKMISQAQRPVQPEEGTFCNITWDGVMCWDRTPAGFLAEEPCPDYINGFSRTGNASRQCMENGQWQPNYEQNNTSGWTNFTSCVGNDNSFMDLSAHLFRIQLMSEIGYGISLASLIIAVLIMFLSKRLHCKSNSLHINLFIAFILRASLSFIKNTLFVEGVGLEKDVTRSPDGRVHFIPEGSHWECKFLTTIFLYAVGASMMWISMEGLYLHMLVYRTLFTERTGIKFYIFLGWLSPLLYIIPWVLVRIYVDNHVCWTTYIDDGYFWIIRAPIILTVIINFVFFIDIVRVLCIRVKSHSRAVSSNSQQFRKLAKFAVVLIPLFGVIYIGFSAYPQGINVHADIIYLYCEMFYNSFQGFMLALLFCFLNEEVHNELRRCFRRRRNESFSTRSIIMSSWKKGSSMSRGTGSSHAFETAPLRSIDGRDRNENPVKSAKQINDCRREGRNSFHSKQDYIIVESLEPSCA